MEDNYINILIQSLEQKNEVLSSILKENERQNTILKADELQADAFEETFHDEGQTDMKACMRAYKEIGFDGVIRTDHAPVMAGESGENPAYEMLGHIFATGYLKGLLEE